VQKTVDLTENGFSVPLEIPAECRGPCHVRVFVEGQQRHALGAANLYVRIPQPKSTTASGTTASGTTASTKTVRAAAAAR
jgi:hypothetical protein